MAGEIKTGINVGHISLQAKGWTDRQTFYSPTGLEVIKLEFILRLKIKRNNWLLADTCTQAANHSALFLLTNWFTDWFRITPSTNRLTDAIF